MSSLPPLGNFDDPKIVADFSGMTAEQIEAAMPAFDQATLTKALEDIRQGTQANIDQRAALANAIAVIGSLVRSTQMILTIA